MREKAAAWLPHSKAIAHRRSAFTLIELLIVVAIVAILAAIATVNLLMAQERALKASDASNFRTIATALQNYYMDYNKLPPADREAGPFMSHTRNFTGSGNGPAGAGSQDGLPWLLYEYKYISDWKTMFCPKYLKQFRGGTTRRGNYPAYHNFRYAYNSAGLSSGGHLGGDGNIMSGTVWILRDLKLGPDDNGRYSGFYPEPMPGFPNYKFPWGEGDNAGKYELVMYSNMAVELELGWSIAKARAKSKGN